MKSSALPKPMLVPLAIFGLLALGGIGFSVYAHGQAVRARNVADQAGRELIARQGAPVSLTSGNLARAQANRETLAGQLGSLQAELLRGAAGTIPDESPFATSQDLYFDIVSTLEALRQEAARLGVRLADGDNENFGFDGLIRRGSAPSGDERHAVYRDRVALDYVVRSLLAAQPVELLAVQRAGEAAPAAGAVVASRRNGAGGLGDSFTVDPSVTAAVPGAIATQGVRVVFTGRTASLRQFLATLAAFERPVVVRSVEVRPAVERPAARSASGAAAPAPARSASPFDAFGFGNTTPGGDDAAAPVPIVQDNLSRFTVTIEAFRLIPEAAAAEEVAP